MVKTKAKHSFSTGL